MRVIILKSIIINCMLCICALNLFAQKSQKATILFGSEIGVNTHLGNVHTRDLKYTAYNGPYAGIWLSREKKKSQLTWHFNYSPNRISYKYYHTLNRDFNISQSATLHTFRTGLGLGRIFNINSNNKLEVNVGFTFLLEKPIDRSFEQTGYVSFYDPDIEKMNKKRMVQARVTSDADNFFAYWASVKFKTHKYKYPMYFNLTISTLALSLSQYDRWVKFTAFDLNNNEQPLKFSLVNNYRTELRLGFGIELWKLR